MELGGPGSHESPGLSPQDSVTGCRVFGWNLLWNSPGALTRLQDCHRLPRIPQSWMAARVNLLERLQGDLLQI